MRADPAKTDPSFRNATLEPVNYHRINSFNASFASVECSGSPTMLSAASPSPFSRRSALRMAYVSALISWP